MACINERPFILFQRNPEIQLGIKNLTPVKVFCDNESPIKLVLNLVFHEKKTKHIEIYLQFVREKIASGILKSNKISSSNQNVGNFNKIIGSILT